jgi:hypothetical protein
MLLQHFGWQVELGPVGVSATTRQEKAVQSLTTQVREYFVKTGVFEILDEAVAANEQAERDSERRSPFRPRAAVSSKRVSSHSRASTPRGTISPRMPSHPSLPKARPLTAPSSTRSESALPALHPGALLLPGTGLRRSSYAGAAGCGGGRTGSHRPPRAEVAIDRILSSQASKAVSPVPSPASTPHVHMSGIRSVFAEPRMDGGPAGSPPASASRDGSSHGPPLQGAHNRTLSAPHVFTSSALHAGGQAASLPPEVFLLPQPPSAHQSPFITTAMAAHPPIDACMKYSLPVAFPGTKMFDPTPGGTSLSESGALHHGPFDTPQHTVQAAAAAAAVVTPAWQTTSPSNTTIHLNMPQVPFYASPHQSAMSLPRHAHFSPSAVTCPLAGSHFANQESRAPSPHPPDHMCIALAMGGGSSIEFLPNGVAAGGSSFGPLLDSSDGRA